MSALAPSEPLSAERRPGAEPVPGYRLLAPLGRGGFGEVWKCEAPGGLCKAIKFVRGPQNDLHADTSRIDVEYQAFQRIKGIRHPFLLALDRVEIIGSELVLVMELADKGLHELLAECQARRLPGIPRDELLAYLAEAAEVLDVLSTRHGLQHLDVKPANLLLVADHVKIADFGLVNTVAGGCPRGVSPIYAAPETFRGAVSPQSDQYSLAVVYHELLTGVPPFSATSAAQLAVQHLNEPPELQRLPAPDRPAVARALAKSPADRFPSCLDFVQALFSAPEPGAAAGLTDTRPVGASRLIRLTRSVPAVSATQFPPPPRVEAARPLPAASPPTGAAWKYLECLGRDGLGELWKVETADGRPQLLRLLPDLSGGDVSRQEALLAQLTALRIPGLAVGELTRSEAGRLAFLFELPDLTLLDRLRNCQTRRQPGSRAASCWNTCTKRRRPSINSTTRPAYFTWPWSRAGSCCGTTSSSSWTRGFSTCGRTAAA